MVRVAELDSAAEYYTRVFGLRELWRDEVSVGMGMAETDAEVVLHSMELPPDRFGNAVCLLDTSKGLR
jgi:catechol-2,3-dioxygenase